MRILTSYLEFRRIVELEDECWTESSVRDAVAAKFPELDMSAVLIQVYDNDFDSFLDLSSETHLEDKGRMQLVRVEATHNTTVQVVEWEDIVALPGPSRAEPDGELNLSQYKLPELPKDIAFAIRQHDWSKPIPRKLRQRVLEWLFHDLCRYSMYPGKLYAEAARQLVWYHKNLADSSFGTGYDSWQQALRNKGKHERRKLPSQGEVLKNRQKFTAKHRTDVVPCCTTVRVSRDVESLDVEDTFEDEHSLCGHKEWMRREMKKPIPDLEKVKDAMDRTFKSRRKYVCNDGPSVSALMEMYPALSDKDQILAEFFRITKVDIQEELHRVTDSHLQNILLLAQEKLKSLTLTTVLDALPTADGAHKQDLQCLALFLTLACLLKETDAPFLTEEVGNAVYPVAVSTGPVYPGAENYAAVEEKRIETTSPAEAVLISFCLYYVFNFEYHHKFRRTFVAFEHLIGLKHSKLGVMCTRLLSSLKKMQN